MVVLVLLVALRRVGWHGGLGGVVGGGTFKFTLQEKRSKRFHKAACIL